MYLIFAHFLLNAAKLIEQLLKLLDFEGKEVEHSAVFELITWSHPDEIKDRKHEEEEKLKQAAEKFWQIVKKHAVHSLGRCNSFWLNVIIARKRITAKY